MARIALTLALMVLIPLPNLAAAIELEPTGEWSAFDVDELTANSSGLEWIDLDGEALEFTFNLTQSAILRVVDAGLSGDRFRVFNNDILLGETSVVTQQDLDIGLDFDAAFANPSAFSVLELVLAAGQYRITGELSQSAVDANGAPLNATVGGINLSFENKVPTPAVGGLLLGGLLAGGLGLLRQRSTKGSL